MYNNDIILVIPEIMNKYNTINLKLLVKSDLKHIIISIFIDCVTQRHLYFTLRSKQNI